MVSHQIFRRTTVPTDPIAPKDEGSECCVAGAFPWLETSTDLGDFPHPAELVDPELRKDDHPRRPRMVPLSVRIQRLPKLTHRE